MTEKPKTIISLLLIATAVLLVLNINTNRRVTRLEETINHLNTNLHNSVQDARQIQVSLWDLSNRIDSINEQIIQSTRLSFDETVLIQGYNGSAALADIKVSFYLKEHNPEYTVSVTARGRGGETHSAVANLSAGRFAANMALPVRDSYVFTFTTSGATLITGELTQLNLEDQLCRRFTYYLSPGHSAGTNRPTVASLNPEFINNTNGNAALEVNKLVLLVESEDGEIIASWDLTPYLQIQGDRQVLMPLEWDHFSLTVGDEPGNIRADEFTNARLQIHDNLGIHYEQLDQLFHPHQFDFRGGSGGAASMPIPVARAWVDAGYSWGFIRIVGYVAD